MAVASTLGQRVLELRKELGRSQKEMAGVVGVATATWQKIERDEGLPTGETLMQFEKLGINPGWVLSGLGPKKLEGDADEPIIVDQITAKDLLAAVNRISQVASTLQSQPQLPRKPQVIDATPVRSTIKYLPQIASAGGGAVVLEESEGYDYDVEDISRDLLGVDPNDLVLLKIKGDSMEPTLSERDIIVVDRSRPRPGVYPTEGRVYLVSIEGDLYAKRARYLLGGDFHWSSDNDLYDPIVVEGPRLNEEKIIGEVVWAWRRV